ncbi:MAG: phosphomethylpyrimidine synthase ThiC [Candidatus Altiarchaeota archaeon]
MFEISKEKIEKRMRNGSIVVLKNSKRNIKGVMVGEGLRVKVNANVGTSTERINLSEELKKAKVAISYGADTIMDLSIGGNLNEIRKIFLRNLKVPIGTVPIYQAFVEKKTDMSKESILKVIEQHCKDGVDFMTLHCGITKEILDKIHKRLILVNSRGGSFLVAWMLENKAENPLFENFSEILEIVKEYEVVISLGDALRPACLHDATDIPQLSELITLGKLTKIARKEKVPVIVEGPGHLPLNEIPLNVQLAKKICDNAPLYVLGPITTDISLGYDHISGAIGGAVACMYGADFLCYVTPSEHLGLPTIEDVKQGVIAAKIAAHSADIAKIRDFSIDNKISKARRELNWNKIFGLSIDKNIKKKYKNIDKKSCSMCGKYCALKIIDKYISRKS